MEVILRYILGCLKGLIGERSHAPRTEASVDNSITGDVIACGCSDLIIEKHTQKRLHAWKTWKKLKNIAIPPLDKFLGEAVPFVNHVFDEFTQDLTAAVQFCIGNSQKIPFTMDQQLKQTLRAEGRSMDETVQFILHSIHNCATRGEDLRGNKLLCEELIPMNDYFAIDSMENVFLYIERRWRGLCLLMILKPRYRLYRNIKNAIIGLVVHNRHAGSAKLLAEALTSLNTRVMEIRSLLYKYNCNSNSYVELKGDKTGMNIIRQKLKEQGYNVVPILKFS